MDGFGLFLLFCLLSSLALYSLEMYKKRDIEKDLIQQIKGAGGHKVKIELMFRPSFLRIYDIVVTFRNGRGDDCRHRVLCKYKLIGTDWTFYWDKPLAISFESTASIAHATHSAKEVIIDKMQAEIDSLRNQLNSKS